MRDGYMLRHPRPQKHLHFARQRLSTPWYVSNTTHSLRTFLSHIYYLFQRTLVMQCTMSYHHINLPYLTLLVTSFRSLCF